MIQENVAPKFKGVFLAHFTNPCYQDYLRLTVEKMTYEPYFDLGFQDHILLLDQDIFSCFWVFCSFRRKRVGVNQSYLWKMPCEPYFDLWVLKGVGVNQSYLWKMPCEPHFDLWVLTAGYLNLRFMHIKTFHSCYTAETEKSNLHNTFWDGIKQAKYNWYGKR